MQDFSLKIAVCDDNAADRKQIVIFLSQYLDRKNLCARIDEFASGEAFLSSNTAEYLLVFLDIYMDGINGMETARTLLRGNSRVQIVFNSSSGEFAAESYDVAALHYMVKPMDKNRLEQVLNKFFNCWDTLRTISVKVGRMEEDVYLSDIIYLEAHGKKSILHTKRGTLESSTPFAELRALLPADEFIRPIRYALAAVREVVNIPSTVLVMSDGTEIPISRNEKANMKKVFADYKWRKLRDGIGGGV